MAVMFAAIAERGFLFKQLHQTFVIQNSVQRFAELVKKRRVLTVSIFFMRYLTVKTVKTIYLYHEFAPFIKSRKETVAECYNLRPLS
jgi:hypothetical protein